MVNFLAILGALVLIILVLFLFCVLFSEVYDLVKSLISKHKQKHSFGKSPTADCYCVDCIYHDNDTKECYKFEGYYTADCWFCRYAKPKD